MATWELYSYLPGKADKGYVFGLLAGDEQTIGTVEMDAKQFEDFRNAVEAMYNNPTKQDWRKL